jgi:hypothetical protein
MHIFTLFTGLTEKRTRLSLNQCVFVNAGPSSRLLDNTLYPLRIFLFCECWPIKPFQREQALFSENFPSVPFHGLL